MLPAHLRVAAGAGLVATALLIVGPGVVAVSADPGHSGERHSRSDGQSAGKPDDGRQRSDQNSSSPRRGQDGRTGPDHGSDRAGSDRRGPSRTGEALGSGDAQVASRSGSSTVAANSPAAVRAPEADVAGVRTAAPSGGSAGGAQPGGSFAAPAVTFGDGRAPGGTVGADQPVSAASPGAAPRSPDPVTELDPASLVPILEPLPPSTALREAASPKPEFVDRVWSPLRPAFPGGLVFGIAGLVLGPLAGVWLGYRQARAAAQLVDR